MYSRCLRQVSVFFDTCPDTLTAAQLKAYFLSLVHSQQAQWIMATENWPLPI
jgi:hypothetical protein|tara:strand:- start:138 stop:293 length:156 start_codon:yes stop_codon:yes gene_type:complete